MAAQQGTFDKKVKIRKRTGKHSKQSGPKDNKESKYQGQGH